MSYASLIAQDNVRQRFLAVLKPKRRVQTWTLVSGFVYKATWPATLKDPIELWVDGVQYTKVTSTTPNASEWSFVGGEIYLRTALSADPDTTFNVAIYPIYCATSDAYFYSTPTDDTSETVYFEPYISRSPSFKGSTTDVIFGYLPVQTTSISLINTEAWADFEIYESSFNKAEIKVYHLLGDDLDVANVALVLDGLMGDVIWSDSELEISIKDRADEFATEWRNDEESFYSLALFPSLDPKFIGKPIRYVYGRVNGFVPVNVDFVDEAPTTSDNRDWCVVGEQTGLSEVVRTVGVGSTTTRTVVDFTEGLNVGDTVWLDRASGVDVYVEITAVSRTPAHFDHAAIATPMTSGDTVKRGFVSSVTIRQDGVDYVAKYGRDYTINLSMAGGSAGFSFSTSLESNLSIPSTLSPLDEVFCTVYGRVNDLTAGGPTFGANDPDLNNLANPVMVIYDVLKRVVGIPESRINLTAFASARTATSNRGLGFAIPEGSTDGFQDIKTTLVDILRDGLLRLYLNSDLKWEIKVLGPVGAATKEATSGEILPGLEWSFEHGDLISDVIVEYDRREIGPLSTPNDFSEKATAESLTAKLLHGVEKQETFSSKHFRLADAQELADRIAFVLGERRGFVSFKVKRSLFDADLGDVVNSVRERLPGNQFVDGTDREATLQIVAIDKSARQVTLTLDDQKGIEDNSGDW